MKLPFKSGTVPYTEAEREAYEAPKRRGWVIGLKRRLAAPHGRYNWPRSPQSRALELRKLGESLES